MSTLAPELLEISRADLVRLGPDVFRRLEQGTIFLVRGADEIFTLADHIERTVATSVSPDCGEAVRAFMRTGRRLPEDAATRLVLLLRELRDTRYLSCLFSDLVAGLGLPTPILIDTGHFRCNLVEHGAALTARVERGELPKDLIAIEQVSEPEPSVKSENTGGHPHRDVDMPHATFQFNFWFPLHDLPETNSLLLFPDIYTANIPYQETPAELGRPETWGYGRPLKRALKLGDFLLFHSQHLHASPTEAPQDDRLVAELRVTADCHDDNANVYRRLFWNLTNFAPGNSRDAAPPPAAERAARLHPPPQHVRSDAATAHELFAALFHDPNTARRATNAWMPETIFAATRKLSGSALIELAERLRAAPFAEDRQLAFVRYLLRHDERALAHAMLADTLARTTSYFFALEIARLSGGAGLYDVASAALMSAFRLAQASTVQVGRYRGDVPTRPWPPMQLLPAEACDTVLRLARVLQEYMAAPGTRPPPLLDHRIFFRNYRTAHLFVEGALVFAWSIFVYVPPERLASVGLSVAGAGDGRQVVGEFDPEGIARDPTGIVTAYYMSDLLRALAQRGVMGAAGLKAPAAA
jgi:hypothetical protein